MPPSFYPETSTQTTLVKAGRSKSGKPEATVQPAFFQGLPEAPAVIIIGGGLSGLVAAYTCLKAGLRVTVLEAGTELGGNIRSEDHYGYLMEAGPNSFPAKQSPELMALIQELELRPLAASSQAKHRFVALGDCLVPIPMTPLSFLRSPLLSLSEKWRLCGEPFIPRRHSAEEETVAAFVTRRFGEGVHRRMIQPFLTGVYAGDTSRLSAQAVFPKLVACETEHGSVVGGLLRQKKAKTAPGTSPVSKQKIPRSHALLNFPEGMQQLITRLEHAIIHLGGTVLKQHAVDTLHPVLVQGEAPTWQVRLKNGCRLEALSLVLATPAFRTAEFMAPLLPALAQTLNDIEYAPITVVYQAFHTTEVTKKRQGFGVLKCWERANPYNDAWLGSLWTSSLFPERAPEQTVLLSHFFGGALHSEVKLWDDTRYAREALLQSQWLLGLCPQAKPLLTQCYPYTRGIPQYTLGHTQRIQQAKGLLTQHYGPYVQIAGNFTHGISLNNCVRSGQTAAEEIVKGLLEDVTFSPKGAIT
jgi:protoporphyrinogen/coproporphyrinogen III oxidase